MSFLKIQNIEAYDPRKVDSAVLRNDWRWFCANWANKRCGRESPYTYNQIADVTTGIARELNKRGGEFHPKDYASPHSRELFRIISGRLGREGISIGKAFDGLYLTEPHSRLIWKGFKTLIVKLKRYEGKMHVPLYLLGEKCYGFITLTSVREINRDKFEALRDRHLIRDNERRQWWDDKFPLYAYEFRFERFDEPKDYVRPQGVQVFVDDVKIEKMRKPFSHPWGKDRQVPILLANVPPHRVYVEPFAGGASLFWKKEPVETEVLNDLDERYVFLLNFLKDVTDKQIEELRKKDFSPSRGKFEELKSSKPKSDVDRAHQLFYLNVHSYGGLMDSFAERTKERSCEGLLDELKDYRERLEGVQVTKQDFEKIIEKYDSKNAFFYLDPPYLDENIQGDPSEFKRKLLEVCERIKGKFLLSFSDDKLVRELFEKGGFQVRSVRRQLTGDLPIKRELLIANYELTIPRALLAKELDFDLEAVDSKHVADLSDAELVSLYKKLHEVYRDRGGVFEALLNASIFVESEMERRNLKREIDDGLSRETAFWITEYPVPIQKASKVITLQEVFDSFPDSIKLPVDVPSVVVCGGLANRGWVTDHDIDLRVSLDEYRADVKRALLFICNRDDVREKLSVMFDTRGGIGHSISLYVPVSGVLTKDSGLRIGKPSQPQKSATGWEKFEYWEIEGAWKGWAASRIERGILEQPKVDGMRMQVHLRDGKVVGVYTEDQLRNRVEAFRKSVEELPKLVALDGKDAIFESEMVEYSEDAEWSENKNLWDRFRQIPREDSIKWIAGKVEGLDDERVAFNVHDLLYLDGVALNDRPATERLLRLREVLKDGRHWHVVDSKLAKDLKGFEEAAEWARNYPNSEGVMLKTADSTYKISFDEAARNKDWAKIKNLKEIDVLVFDPHLVAGTEDVYTWEGYIGPVPEKDLVKYREQDLKNWKGKAYLRIGTCYNVKGKQSEGSVLTVMPVRVEEQRFDGKKSYTWMFPKPGLWRPEKHVPDPLDVAEKLAKLGTRPMPTRKADDAKTLIVRLPECPDKYVFDEDICPLLHRVKIEVDGVWKGQKVLAEELKYPIEDCKLANFYRCRRVKPYYTSLREVGADEWEKRKPLRSGWKEV